MTTANASTLPVPGGAGELVPSIRHLASGLDVSPLAYQLDRHPELWNQHTMRTASEGTPHREADDIWVRYRRWSDFHGDPAAFHAEHIAEWYPCIGLIPGAWKLAREVMRRVGGKTLGGVLLTRIPPGGQVKPHVDRGWHADVHAKYAVQIKGNQQQAFCFDDALLRPEPGDLYTFDNSRRHWVTNESDSERITLIVCVRR